MSRPRARAPPAPAPTSCMPATSRRWRRRPTWARRRRSNWRPRAATKPAHRPDKPDAAAKPADAPPGDAKMRKAVHDAAAYIRGLAELRGRNAEWAERAVREAVSLSADEALEAEGDRPRRGRPRRPAEAGQRPHHQDGRPARVTLDTANADHRARHARLAQPPAGGHRRSQHRLHPDAARHLRADLRILQSRHAVPRRGRRHLPAARRCSRCSCCRSAMPGWR